MPLLWTFRRGAATCSAESSECSGERDPIGIGTNYPIILLFELCETRGLCLKSPNCLIIMTGIVRLFF